MRKKPHDPIRKSMFRGAVIGAITCGILGFASGMAVCIAYHLPIPPLFVTEMGTLLGGVSGATLAYALHFHLGRQLLRGNLWGILAAICLTAVMPPGYRLAAGSAAWVLGLFLGYQTGLVEPAVRSSWVVRSTR